jgi:MFS-type transporter involved in bile tolerance (Atg22 family)
MGPVIFGTVSRLTGGNQRAAILAVGVMFVVGLILLARVRAGGPPLAAHRPSPATRQA